MPNSSGGISRAKSSGTAAVGSGGERREPVAGGREARSEAAADAEDEE